MSSYQRLSLLQKLYDLMFSRTYEIINVPHFLPISSLIVNSWHQEIYYVCNIHKHSEKNILRPEFTNFIVSTRKKLQRAEAVCYSGSVFRHERKQANRYREFTQLGLEHYGLSELRVMRLLPIFSMLSLYALCSFIEHLDIRHKIIIKWNFIPDRKTLLLFLSSLNMNEEKAVDFLRRFDKQDKTLPKTIVDKFKQYLQQYRTNYDSIFDALYARFSIRTEKTISLIRGISYYSGVVYEIEHESLVVGAGGEYVFKTEEYSMLGTGFSIGAERMLTLIEYDEESYISFMMKKIAMFAKLPMRIRILVLVLDTVLDQDYANYFCRLFDRYFGIGIIDFERISSTRSLSTIKRTDQTYSTIIIVGEREINESNINILKTDEY